MLLPQSVIRITLDVRDLEKQLSFSVKQSDSVRRIIVNLTDKGKPYLIGVGCYAVFSATTSKNTVISNGCQIKNHEIIYDLSESDTAVVGIMDAEITLFGKDDEVITAPSFTINVYKSKIGEYAGEVVASDDYSTLKALIGEANSRIAKADEVLNAIKDNVLSISKIGYATLLASAWKGDESPYYQVIAVEGATEYSKVDLLPSVEQLTEFYQKGLAFVTENAGGVVTVYAIGDKPERDYTIQVVITEVIKNE